MTSLKDIIAPAFYPVHNSIKNKEHTAYWLRGGRGASKSSFVAIEIILGMIKDPAANAVCVRKVSDTIRTSILPTFLWAIDKLDVSSEFKSITSPPEITYIRTGKKIIMKGLDDPQKLKSIKPRQGYFKYLWFEEGAEYANLDEMQSVIQSVLRGGQEFVEFVSYNPPAEPFAWINEEARVKMPSRLVHESNYKQVPPEWLGPKFLSDAADMERERPEKFAHVYMGVEVGRTDAIIFSGCYRMETFTPQADWNGPYFGADWGFSQDPNVLVKCWIHEKNLYIEYEEFAIGVQLDDIPRMFDKIPDSRKYKIYADCARPETIAHIKRKGFNIEAAEKWSGSVEDGIAIMKSYDIIIHPRCENVIREMRNYRYKIDKLTSNVLPDIVDKDNHGIDSIRYSLSPIIRKKNGWFM